TNLKIILFIACFLPLPLLVVVVQIWQQKGHPVRTTVWVDAIVNWMVCLSTGLDLNCALSKRFPYGLYVALVIATDVQMFCPLLFFGLRWRIAKWWIRFFRLLFTGQVAAISETFTLRGDVTDDSRELSKRTRSNGTTASTDS